MMPLEVHKNDWEELAEFDPMWAVLSEKDKRGNKREAREFFARGKEEIERLMAQVGELSEGRERALDFGCGVGRLTRALLAYYKEAHGVDVSDEMVRRAEEFTPECRFYVNNSEDLSLFPDRTFDLVYSNIVLQHLPSVAMIGKYVKEFFRVSVPDGLVVFQVPFRKSYRNTFNLKRTAFHLLKSLGVSSDVMFRQLRLHPMRMTAVSQKEVLAIIEESGGEVVKQSRDQSAHFAVFYYCRRVAR